MKAKGICIGRHVIVLPKRHESLSGKLTRPGLIQRIRNQGRKR